MFNSKTDSKFAYVKNSIAAFIGVALLLGVLFSTFYVAHEYVHDCTGEDCPICQYIAECEAFVNHVSTGVVFICAAIVAVLAISDTVSMFTRDGLFTTLVEQKVRLNN